ncbi:MAG: FAD-binding oxidoreductase [Methanobacteriota archaeon]|nr:MAG: FAD-binding oxidoreductase [Euryarchaeota archaeon]
MDPEIREKVRRSLVEAIGEGRVLHAETDLRAYRSDYFYQLIANGDRDRYAPDFAVLPETTPDVQKIVKVASDHNIPIIPKGGGSNLCGMLVPVKGGIVIDTIKMNKIVEVNVRDLFATVQPGITLKELDEVLSGRGLALNQLQGSYKVATIGGSIATAGFPRKHNKYGTIGDRVMSLEVVLADGTVLRTGPKVLYTSTGYRLHQLFVGSEGTLGVITEATLRVEPLPEAHAAVLAYYTDFWSALEASCQIKVSGVTMVGLEAFEISDSWDYEAPAGRHGALVVDFEGTRGEVEAERRFVTDIVERTGGVLSDPRNAEFVTKGYEMIWCGLKAMCEKRRDAVCSYIPSGRLAEFYDKVWNDILPKYGMTPYPFSERRSADMGRYEMAYVVFALPDDEKWHESHSAATREIAELAVSLGGSIAACMGVGLKYRDHLKMEYSETALEMMIGVKRLLDPQDIMNPMKKLPVVETRAIPNANPPGE